MAAVTHERSNATSKLRDHPGSRFSTMLDVHVFSVLCEGGSEANVGSIDEIGVTYDAMHDGSTVFQDHDPFFENLTYEEAEFLCSMAGVIIREECSGGVQIDYFTSRDAMDAAWERAISEIEIRKREAGMEIR